MASANSAFDVLASTTLHNYRNKLIDNITNKARFLKHLVDGGYRLELDGGTQIIEQLLHGTNGSAGFYADYDILDNTPAEGISAAQYAWKQASVSISISGSEEAKNSGSKVRLINLLEAKIKQSEISLGEIINTSLFSDGTGSGSKEITGLQAVIKAGSFGVYGGIDASVFTFWQNQFIDATAAPSFSATGVDNMRTLYHSCMRGNTRPSIIITTQTIFERYEKVAAEVERFVNTGSADVSFTDLKFKGIPIIFDEDCPAGKIYMITREYFRWYVMRGRNFVMSDFQKPDNQDAKVAHILLMAQLGVNNRAAHGVISAQTAA